MTLILAQEVLGLPLTHAQLKKFANRALVAKGGTETLEIRWTDTFLRRNLEVSTKVPRMIDSAWEGVTFE